MAWDMEQLLPHLPVWMLVLFRLTGLFVFAPVLGSASIPAKIKLFWAVALSVCVYPALLGQAGTAQLLGPMLQDGLSLWMLPVTIGLELAIGAVIGFGATMPLLAVQMAGQVVDQQVGTGLAGVINPEMGEDAGGIFGQFYFFGAMMIFLALDGHRAMLGTLLHSFSDVPLGGFAMDVRLLELCTGLLTSMFEVALRISAPLLCLVFLETIAMGFLARTVPQMNLLSIGFPMRIVAGVSLLIAALPNHSGVIADAVRDAARTMTSYIQG